MKQATATPDTRDFGVFYPLHYVVAAFPSEDSARKVKQALHTGGYEEDDVLYFGPKEIEERTGRMIEQAGVLANLGTTVDTIRGHHKLARDGAHFLMIHAPTDDESARVMNVVRREKFRVAQKFHRFAIQELS